MGCCASTAHNNPKSSLPSNLMYPKTLPRSPPPPPRSSYDDVKETVKEVLSETSTALPRKPMSHHSPTLLKNQKLNPTLHPLKPPLAPPSAVEEPSEEASEICSLTESISTTATNLTDDNSGIIHQRVMTSKPPSENPSWKMQSCNNTNTPKKNVKSFISSVNYNPANNSNRRERIMVSGKSPSRRISDQSPGGRNVSGSARIVGSTRADPGESSGRRSRSPVTRVGNPSGRAVGRSESGRLTNPSPARARVERSESGRMKKGNASQEDLIENPLVSLECFIFL